MQLTRTCLLLTALLVLSGCRHMQPDFWRPGTIDMQQQRASQYDPFPDRDAGPDVVGGRPREFAAPYAEPVRNNNRTP